MPADKRCEELTEYTEELERWRGASPFTLTSEELDKAKKLYTEHMLPIREIATIVGIPRSSLSRQLKLMGVEVKAGARKGAYKRPLKPLPEDAGTVSDSEIANRLGISRQAVAKRRKRLGIQPAHPKKSK